MVCAIGKSTPKRLKFQKPVPFPLRESVDSIFHTNLYGDKNPQHSRLKRAQILSHAFPPTTHVSLLFLTIYTKLVYFSYPSTLGDLGLFQDISRILSVGSLCLLIMKVYRGRQIHEHTLFSYFLVWRAPSSIVVLAE